MTKRLFSLILSFLLILSSGAFAAGELPLTENGETLTIGLQQSSTVLSYEDNLMTAWLEEQTGINFEFFIFPSKNDEASTKLELMIASETKLPDIIFNCGVSSYTTLQRYADAKVIIPLDEYYETSAYYIPAYLEEKILEGEAPMMTMDEYLTYTRGTDGKSYSFCTISYAEQNTWNRRAWLNTTWLNELDLEMPETIDELENILTQFVENDMNGNGVQDEIGAIAHAGANGIPVLMNMFCYVSDTENGYYYYLDEEGKIQPQFITDEWREGLKTLNEWVEKGIFSTLSFSQDSASLTAIGSSDPLSAGLVIFNTGSAIASNREDYQAIGLIEGPEGKGYLTFSPIVPTPSAVITTSCENPELAFRFLDFLSGKMGCMVNRYGMEGTNWEWLPEDSTLTSPYGAITGAKAKFILKEDVWGVMQNVNWAQSGPFITTGGQAADAYNRNSNSWLNFDHYSRIYDRIHEMDGLYYEAIIFTGEETEKWSETRSSLKTFLNEQATYFVLGTLDIEDDEVWNNYLAELEKIGYKELIEADQIALDRTLGK